MSAARVMRWTSTLVAAVLLVLVSTRSPAPAMIAPATDPPEPQVIGFSVAGNDPLIAQGVHPADILGAGGVPVMACLDLGLMCTDPDTGADDQIRGLSFGQDWHSTGSLPVQFSVAPGSRGTTGAAVRVEADCSPPEPQADVFGTALDGTNAQVLDGDGSDCGSNSAPGLGLQEGASSSSVRALVGDACLSVDLNCDGVPESPVFLTLASGSPTLASLGATSADILMTQVGFTPVKWADGVADLGLTAGDAINAMCIEQGGGGAYDPSDRILFSLAPGSPTLSRLSVGPADLLLPGRPPVVFYSAASLGLQITDTVNGLRCSFELPQAFVSSVAISGPAVGTVSTPYTFTALVNPITATPPITYVWQVGGQPVVTHTDGPSDMASFAWSTAGARTITVTTSNGGDVTVGSYAINITLHKIYLPVVVKTS